MKFPFDLTAPQCPDSDYFQLGDNFFRFDEFARDSEHIELRGAEDNRGEFFMVTMNNRTFARDTY